MKELFLAVFIITTFAGDKPCEQATGFFYGSKERVFVITNQHVIYCDSTKRYVDSISIRLHVDRDSLVDNHDMVIPLSIGGQQTYHLHPLYDSLKIDIAAIEVDEDRLQRSSDYIRLSVNYIHSRSNPVLWGDEVLVLGFPLAYSDALHNLPLLKRAIISTPFGVPHRGLPLFLVDCNLWKGMSGSPVLTPQSGVRVDPMTGHTALGQYSPKLIGIFSGPPAALMTSDRSSDIGIVWYADLIEEIIQSIPKTE